MMSVNMPFILKMKKVSFEAIKRIVLVRVAEMKI